MISTIKNLKEQNEGVKSQVQEIEEDINKLRNDGYSVDVKLDELEHAVRAKGLSRNNRHSSRIDI